MIEIEQVKEMAESLGFHLVEFQSPVSIGIYRVDDPPKIAGRHTQEKAMNSQNRNMMIFII